ncbi:alpha-hydroxy-acid oxidizing protein [Nonomuraea sp. NN258]|uniref:alpha-hydroxy acid oxidase n=1 Tax=Nonomuraea antri TaxID=2730852 RepID=UPI001568836B|nr:alpha-hydroxy acid oxidase [Nonomuraea antri]NRQ31698.1 alpha-hydroxy-acid oxidizing protein [Nonomuraea antri]
MTLSCLADYERAARRVLSAETWDFVAGGSGAESTLRANLAAFESVFVIPRALRDVAACSTASSLLGGQVSMPLAAAPIAYQRLLHPEGELATARAAKTAGIPFAVSTMSSVALEEVAAVGGTTWFQLYRLRDERRCLELVERAEAAGCRAIMVTVDMPWMGRRLRDVRNRFALPESVTAANLGGRSAAHRRSSGEVEAASAVAEHTALEFAPVTWAWVDMLRGRTRLPLVLKGILDPEDARRAADLGIDGIVVSNHGGRQLDGAIPSVDVLPEIAAAVAGSCEILLDSGVRRGEDIVKALALGASAVLVGRPLMYGLAVGGEDGARDVLGLLAAEFRGALGLAGCDSPREARSLRTMSRAFPSARD